MTVSPTELLTLAGLLRQLQRFQSLHAEDRRAALDAVAETLDLRSVEPERRHHEVLGYRDAGARVRALVLDLEPWMTRAGVELADPAELRALVTRGVVEPASRRAILRAVQVFAEHGGLLLREELFLTWLALLWHEAPTEYASFADTPLHEIARSDQLVLGGLIAQLLSVSGLDDAGRREAIAAAAATLRSTPTAIEALMARASDEIRGDAHLRALATFGVTSVRSREAILRGLLATAYVGGIEPAEEAALHWLAGTWSMV